MILRPVDLRPESSDLDAVLAVMLAHEQAFCDVPDCTRDTVERQLRGPYALHNDHRIVEHESKPVGVVTLESDEARREVYIDVYAVPGTHSSVMSQLVEHGVECARRATSGRDGEWRINSGCILEDASMSAALRDAGFDRQRIYWRMTRLLEGVSATMPAALEGVTLEVARTHEQLDDLYAVYCASFVGHFGYTHRTRDEYVEAITHGESPTPERWWLARLDGRPVAMCIQDDSRAPFATAWVRTLGVIPEARGRGIARWLLQCCLADAAGRGLHDIGLTVDSDNDTGATRLYESIGMKSYLSIALWSLPL